MRLADVSSRVSDLSGRVSDLSGRYRVPERVSAASQAAYKGVSAAGEAACRGAEATYRLARQYPRTSIGAIIVAAALVGGALWYMFGNARNPVQRRRTVTRVRVGGERRRRSHR